jgi:hypothetical protein
MDLALAERPAAEQQRFASLLSASETAGIAELDGIADEMQVGVGLRPGFNGGWSRFGFCITWWARLVRRDSRRAGIAELNGIA